MKMMSRSNPIVPREDDEQRVVVQWAEMSTAKYPDVDLLYHIPNGGYRNGREAARFRQMGVKAGMPDLHLPVAKGMYHSLYIELKRTKGGRVSEAQARMIKKLQKAGNCVCVCYGAEDAIRTIQAYYNFAEKGGCK